MAWVTPKTDWTEDDYYNYDALNRVENNVTELYNLMQGYYFPSSPVSPNTSRTITTIEFYDSLNRIENNILSLKDALHATPFGWITPVVEWISLNPFDYTDANRLETNLLGLYNLLNKFIGYTQRSGAFICGQDNTYLMTNET